MECNTHHLPTEGVMNLAHDTGETMQVCSSLAALLKLALES
jgi:hypothetical protein